jgi:programmed cell death protein 5
MEADQVANDEEQRRLQEQKQQQAENARQAMLMKILSQEARERLSRISLVRADRARAIEDFLINSIRSGTIRGGSFADGRLSEADLVNILQKIEGSEKEKKKEETGKIKFQRRNYDDDEY